MLERYSAISGCRCAPKGLIYAFFYISLLGTACFFRYLNILTIFFPFFMRCLNSCQCFFQVKIVDLQLLVPGWWECHFIDCQSNSQEESACISFAETCRVWKQSREGRCKGTCTAILSRGTWGGTNWRCPTGE